MPGAGRPVDPLAVRLYRAGAGGPWSTAAASCRYEDREHPLPPAASACGSGSARPATATCGSRPTAGAEAPAAPAKPGRPRQVSGMWRGVAGGRRTGQALRSRRTAPFVGHRRAQRLTFGRARGRSASENQGLNRWGLRLQPASVYEGYVWARADKPVELVVGLESRDGARSYAQTTLRRHGRRLAAARLHADARTPPTRPAGSRSR